MSLVLLSFVLVADISVTFNAGCINTFERLYNLLLIEKYFQPYQDSTLSFNYYPKSQTDGPDRLELVVV